MTTLQIFPSAQRYEDKKRMFGWWLKYLLRSDAYMALCNGGHEDDIGSVGQTFLAFGDPRKQRFEEWWMDKGMQLAFTYPAPLTLEKASDTDLKALQKSGNYLLLALPLEQPLAEMKKVVEELHTGSPEEHTMALLKRRHFPVHYRTDEILEKWLAVWDARKKKPDASHIDIADMANIHVEDGGTDDRATRQKLTSRYLQIAQKVIDNAAAGRFAEY
jgi:hypothetical protein